MARVEFPTGIKIQEKKGAGQLEPLLSKLKKYAFNGYLLVVVDDQLEGYITLKDGRPRNALLYTPADKEIKGRTALQKIREMGPMEELRIKVHTNVDIDSLISSTKGKLTAEDLGAEEHIAFEEVDSGKKDEKESERKNLEEELQRRIIEHEMKEMEVEEKEIGVYDMLIKERKGIPPSEPGLFPERYSFENFIVGPNNKFAYTAAREVSRFPGDTFNPLFITSPSGLGKTHLLKSIGHYVLKNHPEMKVEYNTTTNFSTELSKADSDALEDHIQHVDIFLLDDLQFLANRVELQEKIYHIFNIIKKNGGQIVLASDRTPDEIPSLKDRLITRFKSGLVVDIRPPTFETRRAIVKKIINRYEVEVPDDIMDFIAKNVKKNVRELEGALNRILAFSSMLNEEITHEVVKESLSHYTEAPIKEERAPTYSFLPGRSYLIEEANVERGFEIVKGLSSQHSIYIFSRINPQRVQDDFGLSNATIIWLTGRDSENFETTPPNLESLTWHMEELLKEGPVILLDGIEYLIGQTGFDATIQFVRHMVDMVSESETIFLLTISPAALEKKQVSILERELEVVNYE